MKDGYTQRQWDRIVGYGKVPDEYKKENVKNDELVKEQNERKNDLGRSRLSGDGPTSNIRFRVG